MTLTISESPSSPADYATFEKCGVRAHRGRGRSSGLETVGRVAAGELTKGAPATVGVNGVGGTVRVGSGSQVESSPVRCPDADGARLMEALIERARDERDSVGGVVEPVACGVPAGLGDPTMDKLDARLGAAMLSSPPSRASRSAGASQ